MPDISNEDAITAWSSAPTELVEDFGDEGDVTRQYLLNPAIFALLGDISGKTILDAGCGQGYLCRLLTRRGAMMTGVEPAEAWYVSAQQREQTKPLGIHYIQADLAAWHAQPEMFDVVIANMVFMDIPDYVPALHNCVTALKKGGKLIFSLLHPCFEESGSAWAGKGFVEISDYFQARTVKQSYAYFVHRPLSSYLNQIIQEGCIIQQMIEPQLDEDIAKRYHAERYAHVPGYIVIAAQKANF
jgi:2-polyprenyl-3-methyl-5-hydroxy-6-metoxy-1,4-benzoquinol methylase